MQGIAEVVRASPQARCAVSGALRTSEVLTVIAASESVARGEQELFELAEILRIHDERAQSAPGSPTSSPIWASEGMILWRSANQTAVVQALSPSPAAQRMAVEEIGRLIPTAGTPERRTDEPGANSQSVAAHVQLVTSAALLGADLENSRDGGVGWKAALASPTLPNTKAVVVKVPHHGSDNADHADMWSRLALSHAIAVVAPFSSSSKPVPKKSDIDRILSYAERAYCTAEPRGRTPSSDDKVVERRLRDPTRRVRQVSGGPIGHIRVRSKMRGPQDLRVALFDGAYRLTTS
jgi:hypothetical protein